MEEIENKRLQGCPEACSPGKVLKFYVVLMAILVLFKQILFKCFARNSEPFIKYDAFCSHIFDLCVLSGVKIRPIVIEEIRNYARIVFIKIIVENNRWEGCIFHITLDSSLLLTCFIFS